MILSFAKYEAAGNDFVVMDGRAGFPPESQWSSIARRLCDRHRGVGADGILLLQEPTDADAQTRMRIVNADGSEGEMCGNGARCFAHFAHRIGAVGSNFWFQTQAGLHRANVAQEGITISLPSVSGAPRRLELVADGRSFTGHLLIVGVPHLIIWSEDLESLDVARWGPLLRRHPDLGPAGANIDFTRVADCQCHHVRLRTFERGVEAETLACGTGSVATAICYAHRAGLEGSHRVLITPTGGDLIEVRLRVAPGAWEDLHLMGPARRVFESTIELP